MTKRPIIASYYFPNWHVDPRIEKLHGHGWNEWQVVKYATPRFEGHQQPKIPLWGYQDESKPEVMAQKIDAATTYGIDAFIFDWYFFNDGPYRERCLNEGFLNAYNSNDIKFALMWANHNPINSHPGSYWKPAEPTWSGAVDPETFIKCTDYCIEHYLKKPNYLRIDGKLYYSIFDPTTMAKDVGGTGELKALLNDFRARVERSGLGELVLDARVGFPETPQDFATKNQFINDLGFDITSNYGWGSHGPDFPAVDYGVWFERNKPLIENLCLQLNTPYNPVVMTGWDCSPRTVQSDMFENVGYPFGTVVINNTPERFEKALRWTKALADEGKIGGMIHLACWNEWTEGSYLEPDTQYGYGFLQAVKTVFGTAN